MDTAFYVIIFIVSIIIAHLICRGLGFFGTMGGIFKLKLVIWVVVFFCLVVVVDLSGIAPEKDKADTKTEQQVKKENKNSGKANKGDDEDNGKQANAQKGKYILPDSSSRKLTENDLKGLSKKQLRLARNEIYARHGRIFEDTELQNYFESKSWYEGYILPEDFHDTEELSAMERKNIKRIIKYENK